MIKAAIFDLDGTVYRGQEEVPGAAGFIAFLREHGIRPLFVTNRANRVPDRIVEQLRAYGIDCSAGDILTAGQATVQYLKRGRVFLVGEDDMRRLLEDAGMTLTDESPDYVVASLDRSFTYDKLAKACDLIRRGASFVATNPDKMLQMDDGLKPGTGAIIAAIETGSGVPPLVIGKPSTLIMEMSLARLGLPRDHVIAVGDNVETDVPAGMNAGIRTAFILTGVSSRDDLRTAKSQPTWVVNGFPELTEIVRRDNGL